MTEYDPGIRHQASIFVRVPVIFARAAFHFFSYSNSPWAFLVSHSSNNNRATVEDAFSLSLSLLRSDTESIRWFNFQYLEKFNSTHADASWQMLFREIKEDLFETSVRKLGYGRIPLVGSEFLVRQNSTNHGGNSPRKKSYFERVKCSNWNEIYLEELNLTSVKRNESGRAECELILFFIIN